MENSLLTKKNKIKMKFLKNFFIFFSSAGATGNVFLFKDGTIRDKGIAYSGFIGRATTVAIVPTTMQTVNFSLEVQTSDKQTANVSGSVQVLLNPKIIVSKLDFTVNKESGGYLNQWQTVFQALITEKIPGPIRAKAKEISIVDIVNAQKELGDQLQTSLAAEKSLSDFGILVQSCSVSKIVPTSSDILKAIGAEEKEQLLTKADKATHARQMAGAEDTRTLKQFESQTNLKLVEDNQKIIKQQNDNEKLKADAVLVIEKEKKDAELAHSKQELEELTKIPSDKLLSISLVKFAQSGNLNNLNISPELINAIMTAKSE